MGRHSRAFHNYCPVFSIMEKMRFLHEGTRRVKDQAKDIDTKANIEYRTRNYESRSSENQRTALRLTDSPQNDR